MKIAINQPNYIPWRGYFDIISQVDTFIIYDDAQYTKEDWRNRNRLLGANGPFWLTIPVKTKGRLGQRICDTEIADSDWREKHWKSIQLNYKNADFFKNFAKELEELYSKEYHFLTEVTDAFMFKIIDWLKLKTKIYRSSQTKMLNMNANQKIIHLCQSYGADCYLSGPSAKSYLDENLFKESGVKLEFIDYSNYKSYPQIHGSGESHQLSILDLLLNCGPTGFEVYK